uniref:Uncharacterized protein n=1 Tax=Arundo donax TaxID=35708 RepID=A0A0A8ZGM2_ARUDO
MCVAHPERGSMIATVYDRAACQSVMLARWIPGWGWSMRCKVGMVIISFMFHWRCHSSQTSTSFFYLFA